MKIKPYSVSDLPNSAILLQPNIPKPLHGMNPRTILGQDWWDEHRQEAYRFFAFKCWACGVSKRDAKYHRWLEGHEAFTINYKKGRMEMTQIMALCHACHNFIHSGRLLMMCARGEIDSEKFLGVLHHGFSVLKEGGHPPNWYALHAYYAAIHEYGVDDFPLPVWHDKAIYIYEEIPEPDLKLAPWGKWRLIIDSKKYKPLHKDFEAWQAYYQKPDIESQFTIPLKYQ